jgi:N-acetylglucosamine-6-phosphate deacetylase
MAADNSVQVIRNGRLFDGQALLDGHGVVIQGNTLAAVLPDGQLPETGAAPFDLAGGTLVPGFIDLQVNGGGGVLFNSTPTPAGIRRIGEAHRAFGTTGFLPTLVTDNLEVMRQAVDAVATAMAQGVPGVLGIHLEGPFLNVQRKGVHDAGKFRVLDEEGFDVATSLRVGRTLLTLAPELASPAVIRRLVDAGVIVSAGHTAASFEQVQAALAAGLTGFTHLYNAMPPMLSRDPGVVGAALASDDTWFGIIADGHHVHPAAVRVAVRARPGGGAILVTDAMPCVGADADAFEFDGRTIRVEDGRCVTADGTLAGSDLDMLSAVHNAVKFAAVDFFEAVRMASLYPARALRLDNELGYLRPGYRASMVALDSNLALAATWIDGRRL